MEQLFRNFEMVEELGAGGMGTVYKARDKTLDRIVALKVPHKHLSKNPQFLAYFKREAQSMAKLSHPNVVSIYSAGIENDHPFFVMEYVDGVPLNRWLKRNPTLRLSAAVDLMIKIGEGVMAAHALNIVHRDLKPENVLIDDRRRPRITDFGLAKILSESEAVSGSTYAGTPKFMAPEQKRSEPVDLRADIYSLGLLFCIILEPKLMNVGTDFGAASLSSDAPRDLRAILARMTEKNKKKRCQTLDEVVAALRRVAGQAGASSSARTRMRGADPTIATPSPARPEKKKRTVSVAVGLAAMAFIVAAVMLSAGRGPQKGMAEAAALLDDHQYDAAIDMFRQLVDDNPDKAALGLGYAYLLSGNPDKAKESFSMISDQVLADEGLAAVAFRTGEDSESIDKAATPYAAVLRGNRQFDSGSAKLALDEYRPVESAEFTYKWQKAEFLLNMSRAFLEEGRKDEAKRCAEAAAACDPRLASARVVLGRLAEENSEFGVADRHYAAADGSELAEYFRERLARREESQADAESIRAQIRDLGKLKVEGSPTGETSGGPPPNRVFFVPFESSAGLALDSGYDRMLTGRTAMYLQRTGSISLVERSHLDVVLQEQSLTANQLADSTTCVRVGNILSAKYGVTGEIDRDGDRLFLNLTLIDMETSEVLFPVDEIEFTTNSSGREVARTAADGLAAWFAEKRGSAQG